ncbi:MAG TPA: hypothetical protein PLP05_04605, partial [Sedimentisphaerales bacterium]|nr:hypothetical protein [Sedimentisphaerales bacterium]
QYKPYEAKIELTIKPNISEGNLLRLEIEMVRQDFIEANAVANKPKNTSNSNVLSIVTVPDGSTIILGGLTKLNQSRGGIKTPLLGDVPLFGNLFRSVSKTDKANHLYIFVKANILRPESVTGMSQLKEISESNRASFEKQETKFQNYEDFTGIKSDPMEPINVLETK